MNSPTYLTSKSIEAEDIPADFDLRLAVATSIMPGNHDAEEILLATFRDGASLRDVSE